MGSFLDWFIAKKSDSSTVFMISCRNLYLFCTNTK